MNQDIENVIKQIISKMMKVPTEKIDSNAIFFELGISSIQFFECAAKIEDFFGISFSERDLIDLYTINDVVDKVAKKLNENR